MSDYLKLLRDPRWQRRRLEILQLADFKCEECGARDRELHVHHRIYRGGAKPWEYADHELASLCKDCHQRITATLALLKETLVKLDGDQLARLCGYARGMLIANKALLDEDASNEPGAVLGASDLDGLSDALRLPCTVAIYEALCNEFASEADLVTASKTARRAN
jgi:hypothetical protein